MYKLLSPIIAITAEQIIDAGEKVGTSSNQVILGVLVIALILVVVYREYQQVRSNRVAEQRHIDAMAKSDFHHESLANRMDKERAAWDEERRARIAMLMTMITDNTKAMESAALAQRSVTEAVSVNTHAVNSLRDLLYEMRGEVTDRRGNK